MDRFVRRTHLVVRPHVDRRRNRACGRRGIAAAHDLHTTLDIELARSTRTGIEDDVQFAFAFEAGIELVEQGANPLGEIRSSSTASHNGDRLRWNLPDLDCVEHDGMLEQMDTNQPRCQSLFDP